MKHSSPITCLLILAVALLCSRPALGLTQAALDATRSLWDQSQAGDYNFTFRRDCFCLPEYTSLAFIRVRGGELQKITNLESNYPLQIENYPTIGELFDELQQAINFEAQLIEASFDEAQGYPSHISIDWNFEVADDEISYFVYDEQATADPIPTADFNQNYLVDDLDLEIWKRFFYYNVTFGYGDADGDLDADGADFLQWQRESGLKEILPAYPQFSVVPEPTALVLALLAGTSFSWRFRAGCSY